MVFDIRNFGAKPENEINTAEIQAAVNACRESGGGRVEISGGTYKTG